MELLWAAAENNIAGLRRLVAQGVPVHAQDYDQRTAIYTKVMVLFSEVICFQGNFCLFYLLLPWLLGVVYL